MCGLFGFSGWDKANLAKLKMLGLYNLTRGRDSCGYFFNNKLVKGFGQKKEWKDFIESEIIDEKGDGRLFIGHTRAATYGQHTEENAHPFNIKDKYILAHNGTISNIWELCNKYGVDHKEIHVDSLALGHLLDMAGYRILEEYKGYAALLFTRLSEPGKLFAYHGASRLLEKDDKPTEERPMFYMQTKEGVYFSSMENSLKAIRDAVGQVPQMLEHNRLITITNGKFSKSKVIIRRDDVNIGVEKKNTTTTKSTQTTAFTYPSLQKSNPSSPNTTGGTTTPTVGTKPTTDVKGLLACSNNGMGTAILPSVDDYVMGKDIWEETKPLRCFSNTLWETNCDFAYYFKGRYWSYDDKHLLNGIILLDKYGVIYKEKGAKIHDTYFYRGVKIRDKQAWEEMQKEMGLLSVMGTALVNFSDYNFAQYISRYSQYPVSNLEDEGVNLTDTLRKSWWRDFKLAEGSIQPVWADRNYIWRWGNLIEIKSEDPRDITFIPNGETEWVNVKYFETDTKQTSQGFNGGEIVKKNMNIKNLAKHFDTIYTDFDQVMADCPTTVFLAIRLYINEVLSENNYIPDREEISEVTNSFIKTAISDRITFRDNMDESHPSAEVFLSKAYREETKDEDADARNHDELLIDRVMRYREGYMDVEEAIVIEDDKKKVLERVY